MARPKQERYNIEDMVKKVYAYTEKSELPIIKECCLQNGWSYDYLMQLKRENDILAQAIKRLLDKKEVILEQLMVSGKANVTACIFTLKQHPHGWTDRQDVKVANEGEVNIILNRK